MRNITNICLLECIGFYYIYILEHLTILCLQLFTPTMPTGHTWSWRTGVGDWTAPGPGRRRSGWTPSRLRSSVRQSLETHEQTTTSLWLVVFFSILPSCWTQRINACGSSNCTNTYSKLKLWRAIRLNCVQMPSPAFMKTNLNLESPNLYLGLQIWHETVIDVISEHRSWFKCL